jgi:hypothetical protein
MIIIIIIEITITEAFNNNWHSYISRIPIRHIGCECSGKFFFPFLIFYFCLILHLRIGFLHVCKIVIRDVNRDEGRIVRAICAGPSVGKFSAIFPCDLWLSEQLELTS